ncbi:MAG: hypothetical protein WB763_02725 [Terriglobia bacterium]
MSKTAVGLFENPDLADQVVRELEASGFPQNDVRILRESLDMKGSGVMGIPNIDFEVSLNRELRTIGASGPEAEAYVKGVRGGGVLVFASGTDEKIDAAAEIMNRHSPVEVEELTGAELNLPSTTGENVTPTGGSSVQTGRVRQAGGGARVFAW